MATPGSSVQGLKSSKGFAAQLVHSYVHLNDNVAGHKWGTESQMLVASWVQVCVCNSPVRWQGIP